MCYKDDATVICCSLTQALEYGNSYEWSFLLKSYDSTSQLYNCNDKKIVLREYDSRVIIYYRNTDRIENWSVKMFNI